MEHTLQERIAPPTQSEIGSGIGAFDTPLSRIDGQLDEQAHDMEVCDADHITSFENTAQASVSGENEGTLEPSPTEEINTSTELESSSFENVAQVSVAGESMGTMEQLPTEEISTLTELKPSSIDGENTGTSKSSKSINCRIATSPRESFKVLSH